MPRLHELHGTPRAGRGEARTDARPPAPAPADPKRKPAKRTSANASTLTTADTDAMQNARERAATLREIGLVPCYVVDTPGAPARVVSHFDAAELVATGRYTARLTPR